jgi:hypothetical protein
MMAATHDDKPDWFRPPPTVTSATICRLSGKLATDGCSGVTTVDDHGNLTVKSMVYTDYFVRGTEPVEYCPLHDHAYGAPAVVATTGNAPEPERARSVVPAVPGVPAPPAVAGVTPTDQTPDAQAEPEQRRGFWSRFFRRGNRDPQQPGDTQQETAPAPGR